MFDILALFDALHPSQSNQCLNSDVQCVVYIFGDFTYILLPNPSMVNLQLLALSYNIYFLSLEISFVFNKVFVFVCI